MLSPVASGPRFGAVAAGLRPGSLAEWPPQEWPLQQWAPAVVVGQRSELEGVLSPQAVEVEPTSAADRERYLEEVVAQPHGLGQLGPVGFRGRWPGRQREPRQHRP